MGLSLIEAATGCLEAANSRLDHLAVNKTFVYGELLCRLALMNNAGGGGLFFPVGRSTPRRASER